MKKIITSIVLASCLNMGFAHAQTTPTAGVPAASTPEQKAQEIAGFIYACAIAKPVLGWKSMTISLDKSATGLNLFAVATTGDNQIKKITLCDRQQVAQAMIDMLNTTTQGKAVEWQSLLFRSQPNQQFEFRPLTTADINKLAAAAPKTAQ
jgi:hypothetical protein